MSLYPNDAFISTQVQNMRMLTLHSQVPVPSPSSTLPFPLTEEEYYRVDIQKTYSNLLPSMERGPDGKWRLNPGALFGGSLADPFSPDGVFAQGLVRFHFSGPDRVLHTLIAAAYVAVAAVLFGALWSFNASLSTALLVNWARGRLSIGKLVVLLSLAWFDRMWLYWVFFAGGLVDALLARVFPILRK